MLLFEYRGVSLFRSSEEVRAMLGNCCKIPDSCNGLPFAGDGPTGCRRNRGQSSSHCCMVCEKSLYSQRCRAFQAPAEAVYFAAYGMNVGFTPFCRSRPYPVIASWDLAQPDQ